MSEQTESAIMDESELAVVKRRNPLRRIGCGLILALWFLFLLTPCALFYLAANGEIRLYHADIPEPHSHPLLLISLINDVENRGLQILRSAKADADDTSLCVETTVNYLLWATTEGNQDVVYCDCYTRADSASAWTLTETHLSTCA